MTAERSALRAAAHRVVWGLGLQGLVFRMRERRIAGFGAGPGATAAGAPLPPPLLRVMVCGTADPDYFLESGRRTMAEFDELLRQCGRPLADAGEVLDVGCGCGRLAQWFPGDPARLTGVDVEPRLVAWSERHIPGPSWWLVRLGEPLPAPDNTFGAAYACSVITHLRRDTAAVWLTDLARVLTPGGLLLLTFHDERHPSAAPVAAELGREGYAVRFDHLEGSNLLAAYVTLETIRGMAPAALEPVAARASDETVCGQAVAVFRKAPEH